METLLVGNCLFTYDGEARGVIPVVVCIYFVQFYYIFFYYLRKSSTGNSRSPSRSLIRRVAWVAAPRRASVLISHEGMRT